jgi:hypothetical protein
MKFEAYYVVRPAISLLESLRENHSDAAKFLLTAQLWRNAEGGRTAWRPADHTRRVKRAFVVHMADMLREDEEFEFLGLTREPNESEFDRWWLIERFDDVDEDTQEIEKRYGITPRLDR